MADEINLEFIARQLERVLSDQRDIRTQLAGIRDELTLLRGEFQLLREQVRIQGLAIARIEDTLRENVFPLLRALEDR